MPETGVRFLLLALLPLIGACSTAAPVVRDSGPKHVPLDPWSVPPAVPKAEPRSRYGNPESYVVFGKRYHVLESAEGYREKGLASWYGTKFHGRRTSSGEPYDMFAMTAAHKTLPLPTYVRVTNLENGRSLIVKVNDRGPFHPGRIIDLSYTAAVQLGVHIQGFAKVEVETVYPDEETVLAEPEASLTPPPDTAAMDALISSLQTSPEPASPAVTLDEPQLPYLELGAFPRLEQCHALREELKQRNLLALQVQSVSENANIQCRVVQGPFATPADAEVQAGSLRQHGYKPAVTYP